MASSTEGRTPPHRWPWVLVRPRRAPPVYYKLPRPHLSERGTLEPTRSRCRCRSSADTAALSERLAIEPDGGPLQPRPGRRVALQHQRIVARDDMPGRAGEPLQACEALEHVANIVDGRIGPHLFEICVEMRGVGG